MIQYLVQAGQAGVKIGLWKGFYEILEGDWKSGLISMAGGVGAFTTVWFIDNYFDVGLVGINLYDGKQKIVNITSIDEEIQCYVNVELNQTLVKGLSEGKLIKLPEQMLIEGIALIVNAEFMEVH
jgi:hypothetical protein